MQNRHPRPSALSQPKVERVREVAGADARALSG